MRNRYMITVISFLTLFATTTIWAMEQEKYWQSSEFKAALEEARSVTEKFPTSKVQIDSSQANETENINEIMQLILNEDIYKEVFNNSLYRWACNPDFFLKKQKEESKMQKDFLKLLEKIKTTGDAEKNLLNLHESIQESLTKKKSDKSESLKMIMPSVLSLKNSRAVNILSSLTLKIQDIERSKQKIQKEEDALPSFKMIEEIGKTHASIIDQNGLATYKITYLNR